MKRTIYGIATLSLLLIGFAASLPSPQPADAQGTGQTFTVIGKDVLLSQSGTYHYQPKYPDGGPAQPPPTQPPAAGPPTPCPITFTDVSSTHTYYTHIRCLACRDIMGGYSDGTFRPNNNITRGQLAKIVAKSAGFNEPVSGQTFEDVEDSPPSTFYEYVERMSSRGIINGYPCGGASEPCITGKPYFRPNADATRGQISKIISEAAEFSDPQTGQTFEDVPPSSTFYLWIERLASRGIMSGYPCGALPSEPCGAGNRPYFRPNNYATRGQTSKIVANTFFPNCITPNRTKP